MEQLAGVEAFLYVMRNNYSIVPFSSSLYWSSHSLHVSSRLGALVWYKSFRVPITI